MKALGEDGNSLAGDRQEFLAAVGLVLGKWLSG